MLYQRTLRFITRCAATTIVSRDPLVQASRETRSRKISSGDSSRERFSGEPWYLFREETRTRDWSSDERGERSPMRDRVRTTCTLAGSCTITCLAAGSPGQTLCPRPLPLLYRANFDQTFATFAAKNQPAVDDDRNSRSGARFFSRKRYAHFHESNDCTRHSH